MKSAPHSDGKQNVFAKKSAPHSDSDSARGRSDSSASRQDGNPNGLSIEERYNAPKRITEDRGFARSVPPNTINRGGSAGNRPSSSINSQAHPAHLPFAGRHPRENASSPPVHNSRSPLNHPSSTTEQRPFLSFSRTEPRTQPFKSSPIAFDRVAFVEETPASARDRADRVRPLSHLSTSLPAGYQAAPTLEERKQITLQGPLQGDELNVAAELLERFSLENRRAKKSAPRKEVVVKQEPVPALIPRSNARKSATTVVQDVIEIESDEETGVGSSDWGPSVELFAAIRQLSYHTLCLQLTHRLPFLRRNLKKGFFGRCAMNGMRTRNNKETQQEVVVVYRLSSASGAYDLPEEYEDRIRGWLCPICELHGYFATREMLGRHLQWDHKEVGTVWTQGVDGLWRITVTIPEPVEEIFSDSPSPPDTPVLQPTPVEFAQPLSSIVIDLNDTNDVKASSNRLKYQFAPSTMQTATPSSTFLSQPWTRSQALPPRDPLGPLAQYPYLPCGDVQFSCRPGGPRLYDIISDLPVEPYGVLSWYIIDKEEELFEIDNTRDEDKVMQALWNRWIFLNRRQKFIPDYFKGTRSFISEYWQLIHLAAGWAALRVWLLLLAKMRYLTGRDVAQLLRHYEKLVEEHDSQGQTQ